MEISFNIAIVEDDKIYSEIISEILNDEEEFTVEKIFPNVEELFMFLKKDNTLDIILLDVGLPGMDGVTAIDEIRKINSEIKIIMLTIFDDDETIFNSAKAGANGFLLKGDSDEKIIKSIHEVLAGGGAFSAGVAAKVLNYFNQLKNKEDELCLTPSEYNTLTHFASGKTKKEIAEYIHRSTHAVDSQIRNIYKKLHVCSRAEAVYVAVKRGLI